jgi:hypothetical protein
MPNTDWMAGFTNRGDLQLTDITFPASHDAGLSEADDCYIPYGKLGARDSTICHYYNIGGQLNAGSRAFDIRFDMKNGEARTIHGEGVIGGTFGGWGQTASSIIQQVNTFLTAHPGEIVILRISHTTPQAAADVARLATLYLDRGNRLYKAGPRNIAVQPLNQLRGKAIVVYDEKALATTDPYQGKHRFMKYKAGQAQAGLPICGGYAGQLAGFKDMVKKALKCGNEHGAEHAPALTGKHDHLFMIYWQLANDVKNKTTKGQEQRIKTMIHIVEDKGTHYNLDYILNVHRGNVCQAVGGTSSSLLGPQQRKKYRPNWINLDFVNDYACGKVIEFNTELLA